MRKLMNNGKGGTQTEIHRRNGIKLGQITFSSHPEDYDLLGIGTCIAVYLFDLTTRYYAMAHTVLPSISATYGRDHHKTPGKFVDKAIQIMIEKMIRHGSKKANIKAKIVGGAQIFDDTFKIGVKNAQMAQDTLLKYKIPILSQDIGGRKGRSVVAFNSNGTILIRKQKMYFTI